MLKYAILAVVAALISFLATPWVRQMAVALGAVDEPAGRRIHQGRVPRLGGLAVFAAFLGTLLVGGLVDLAGLEFFLGHARGWLWILGGALVVVAVGALDDVWHLGPGVKFLMQLVAASLVVVGGHGIESITNPFGESGIPLGWLSVPVTLIWVVGVTNAFNLIDGLDGLAAGVALIASGTLFLVSLSAGNVDVALLSVALAGALAGFLYYNFNPASIFLGDTGSLLLGYLLSVLSIRAAQKGATTVVVLVPILALGLPIMDTLLALARRVLGAFYVVRSEEERNRYSFEAERSISPFQPDQHHIHHRLLAAGWSQRVTVLLLYGVCCLFGLVAFLTVTSKGTTNAIIVTAIAVATFIGIRRLGYAEVEVFKRGALLPLFDMPVVNRRLFHALIDSVFLGISYALAFFALFTTDLPGHLRQYLLQSAPLLIATKLACFMYARVYWRAYRYTSVADLLRLTKAVVMAQFLAFAAVALALGLPREALPLMLLDFYFTATCVIGARLSFKLLEMLASGPLPVEARAAVLYGSGRGGSAVLQEIRSNPSLGYNPLGFIDDFAPLWHHEVDGLPILGGIKQVEGLVQHHNVREIIVTTDKITPDRLEIVRQICGRQGVTLRRFRITLDEFTDAAALPVVQADSELRSAGTGPS